MTARRVDVLAVAQCVDLGHHWRTIRYGRAQRGALSGLHERTLHCMACATQRIEVLGSNGGVISRRYVADEGYVEAMRSLGDPKERRAEYRRRAVEQASAKEARRATKKSSRPTLQRR